MIATGSKIVKILKNVRAKIKISNVTRLITAAKIIILPNEKFSVIGLITGVNVWGVSYFSDNYSTPGMSFLPELNLRKINSTGDNRMSASIRNAEKMPAIANP